MEASAGCSVWPFLGPSPSKCTFSPALPCPEVGGQAALATSCNGFADKDFAAPTAGRQCQGACCHPLVTLVTLSFDLLHCWTERRFLEAHFGKTAQEEIDMRPDLLCGIVNCSSVQTRCQVGPFLPGVSTPATEPPEPRFSTVKLLEPLQLFKGAYTPAFPALSWGHGRRATAMPGPDARAPGHRDAQ